VYQIRISEIFLLCGLAEADPKIKPETISRNNELQGKINFVLCGACFWCVSYLNYKRVVIRCPTCDSNNIESLPISNGEVYL
jgi:uncharacterized CHY-type Zn-finger protein